VPFIRALLASIAFLPSFRAGRQIGAHGARSRSSSFVAILA
jgi:hypothetical protein